MAMKKRTEVLTLTREEVVWALMMYGYPVGSTETPDAATRLGHAELVALHFTYVAEESVYPTREREQVARPDPVPVPPPAATDSPLPPLAAAKTSEPDIPF